MGTKALVVARLESSLTSGKHSPSLATLRKYARAVGLRLEIHLVHAQAEPNAVAADEGTAAARPAAVIVQIKGSSAPAAQPPGVRGQDHRWGEALNLRRGMHEYLRHALATQISQGRE